MTDRSVDAVRFRPFPTLTFVKTLLTFPAPDTRPILSNLRRASWRPGYFILVLRRAHYFKTTIVFFIFKSFIQTRIFFHLLLISFQVSPAFLKLVCLARISICKILRSDYKKYLTLLPLSLRKQNPRRSNGWLLPNSTTKIDDLFLEKSRQVKKDIVK